MSVPSETAPETSTAARIALSVLLLAAAALRPAGAADTWALCEGPLVPPAPATASSRDDPDTAARIRAEQAEYDQQDRQYRLRGNVTLDRADQHAEAQRGIYNDATGRADLLGDILYREQGFQLTGDRGFVDLDDDRGRVTDARYRIEEGHIHGSADVAQFNSRSRSRYEGVSFTTCEVDNEDWWLRADELRIDRAANEGVATDAWLSFYGVPLFYTPYISFPVSDARKSGFLAPSFGRSTRSGNTIEIPYYWNIAPNYDLTLRPRYMSRRGLLLGSRFRYLQPWLEGEMRVEYLPDDDRYGDDRWLHSQHHVFEPMDRFRAEIDYNEVSDKQYFDDFGNQLDDLYRQRLESSGSAAYYGDYWDLSARWQRWQVLDQDLQRSRYPYERKPQVVLDLRPPELAGFDFSVDTEAVRFEHVEPQLRDTGNRLDTRAELSYSIRDLGYFLEPTAGYRYTTYRLDRTAPTAAEEPSRQLPYYSVDGGLVFQRNFSWFDTPLQQTLEPRLFYAYVPYRDQDELPLFDTSNPGLTMNRLFQVNRFTGADRMGDTNHLAYALTTRFLDRGTGRSYLSLSAGQRHFFEDRQVQLSAGAEPETRAKSDYILELRAHLPPGLSLRWDYLASPYESGFEESQVSAQIKPAPDTVLNLDYRIKWNEGSRQREQTSGSLVFPVTRRIQLFGGAAYSHLYERDIERFGGFEYSDCCWAVRMVHRLYLSDLNDIPASEYERETMLELEFKGLGGVGDTILEFLQDAVPGYTRRY